MADHPLRALVVEGNAVLGTSICAWLRRRGHPSLLCSCLQEARGLLSRQRFELVVLAWSRCDEGGEALELTKWLRAGRADRLPAIVMLSEHTLVDDVQAALEAGVTDLLTKPVVATHLRERLSRAELAARIARRQEELEIGLEVGGCAPPPDFVPALPRPSHEPGPRGMSKLAFTARVQRAARRRSPSGPRSRPTHLSLVVTDAR
ncbi:MAG: response regulator [Proteobacteria bacterium]|nr:response regulator [Pseudomonadota bacterium]